MDVIINAQNDSLPSEFTLLNTQGDFWLNVVVQLGQDPLHTPLAEFFRVQRQLPVGDYLLISPIHWEVTHNDALITAYGKGLQLTEGMSKIWFAEVSQFLAQDGFDLIYISPDYYLMNIAGKPPLISPNLPAMQSRSLMPILEELDKTMYWQRLFTELQMFLSSHPLNTPMNKHQNPLTPINGYWFWGGGAYVPDSARPPLKLITDNPDLFIQSFFPAVTLLDLAAKMVDEDAVLIISEFSAEKLEYLVKISQKIAMKWIWNNVAYLTKPLPWYKRLKALLVTR